MDNNFLSLLTNIDINNLLNIFDIQIAIAMILIFTLFRGAFATAVIKLYYKIIKKNKKAKDSSLYKYLTTLSVLIGVYLAINILPTNKQVLYYMSLVFKITVIIFITKCLTTLTAEDSIVMKYFTKDKPTKPVNILIAKIVRAFIWIISGFIIFLELGYDLSGLAASLGVGAVVISLAAQDMVKSLLGGIAILTDKPFIIGDWIECGKYQGTVIDITYRSTRIKSANNAVITIPNSIITADYVINWNRLTSRRIDTNLTLALDTTSEKLNKITKQVTFVLANDPEVIDTTVQVNVTDVSSAGINVQIFYYVRETDYYKFLKVKQKMICKILDVLEKENVELAYPAQSIYLKERNKIENVEDIDNI